MSLFKNLNGRYLIFKFLLVTVLFLLVYVNFKDNAYASGNWTFSAGNLVNTDSNSISFKIDNLNCSSSNCVNDFAGGISSLCLGTSQSTCDISPNSFSGNFDFISATFDSPVQGNYYILLTYTGNNLVSETSYQFPVAPSPTPSDSPTPTFTPTPTPDVVYVTNNNTTTVVQYVTTTPVPTQKPTLTPTPTKSATSEAVLGQSTQDSTSKPFPAQHITPIPTPIVLSKYFSLSNFHYFFISLLLIFNLFIFYKIRTYK